MDALSLTMLSLIQGIAEWLPVSSEGLTTFIMLNVLRIDISSALKYAVFLHLGTTMAVILKFRNDFIEIIKFSKLTLIIVVTTVFTALTAIPLVQIVELSGDLANLLIGLTLIFTGIIIRYRGSGLRDLKDLKLKEAAILGLLQGLAIIPGISRSGTTVTYLLLRKIKEDHSLKLSFIVSVPAVLGAIAFEGLPSGVEIIPSSLATFLTFSIGYITIDLLMRIARSLRFSKFCISFGSIAILGFFLTKI